MNLSLFFVRDTDTVGAFTRECKGNTRMALEMAQDILNMMDRGCPLNDLFHYLEGWSTIDDAEEAEIHYLDDANIIFNCDNSKVDAEGAFDSSVADDAFIRANNVQEIICSILQDISYEDISHILEHLDDNDYFTDDNLMLSVIR